MTCKSNAAARTVLVYDARGEDYAARPDDVAVEEPLEISIKHVEGSRRPSTVPSNRRTTICVTMRTPGTDGDLVTGYLHAEGVIKSIDDIAHLPHAAGDDGRILVELNERVPVDLRRLQRNVFTTSACGVCAAPSLDAIAHADCPDIPSSGPAITTDVIHSLPTTLSQTQEIFRRTGGLHAAALFDLEGKLLRVREDVGRHNALDKLIGASIRAGDERLNERVVLVSGRASYELVQKVLMAGVPILAAVGAPSSLAIDLAQAYNLTLLGFVRAGRFNIYNGEARVKRPAFNGASASNQARAASPAQATNPAKDTNPARAMNQALAMNPALATIDVPTEVKR